MIHHLKCSLTLLTVLIFPSFVGAQEHAPLPGNSLTLAQAIRHHYIHDPALQASYAALRAMQERYPQALAGWRPSAEAQAGTYAADIHSDPSGAKDGTFTKEISLNIEQPLYRGGRTRSQINAAKAAIMAARADTVRAQQDSFYDVAVSYITVARDRTLLDLRYRDEERLQQELMAVNERFIGGDLTITDVNKTQAELARAQSNTVDMRGQLDTSMAAFEDVIGLPVPKILFYPDTRFPFPEELAAIIDQALANNPALLSVRHAREAAEYDADSILRELYPQLFAYAGITQQWDPQPGTLDEYRNSIIGVRATLSLYEGGATRSRVRQAKQIERQHIYDIADTESAIQLQVSAAWRQWIAARQAISHRHKEISAMEKALEGIREESRVGTRTILDVLETGEDLIQSRFSLAMARYQYYISAFQLARAMGILTPEFFQAREGGFNAQAHLDHIADLYFSTDINHVEERSHQPPIKK